MTLKLQLEKTPAQIFSRRLVGIKYIQDIQKDLMDAEVFRLEQKLRFVNEAYIMQLVAQWQVFVEELLDFGYRTLLDREGPSAFARLTKSRIDEAKKRFNTPNQSNIDKLFEDLFGVKSISSSWTWDGISRQTIAATLASVLKARHEIAHTGHTSTKLSYETNFNQMEVIFRIATATENTLLEQLSH